MQHEIRTIRPDELENLEKVASKVWHQSYDVLLGPEQVDYMLDMFQNQKASCILQRKPALWQWCLKAVTGVTCPSKSRKSIWVEVSILVVARLIHIHDGCDSVYLTVNKKNPVRKMYEYMGFKIVKSVVTDIGEGYVMDDYVMQWDISGTTEEDE